MHLEAFPPVCQVSLAHQYAGGLEERCACVCECVSVHQCLWTSCCLDKPVTAVILQAALSPTDIHTDTYYFKIVFMKRFGVNILNYFLHHWGQTCAFELYKWTWLDNSVYWSNALDLWEEQYKIPEQWPKCHIPPKSFLVEHSWKKNVAQFTQPNIAGSSPV